MSFVSALERLSYDSAEPAVDFDEIVIEFGKCVAILWAKQFRRRSEALNAFHYTMESLISIE